MSIIVREDLSRCLVALRLAMALRSFVLEPCEEVLDLHFVRVHGVERLGVGTSISLSENAEFCGRLLLLDLPQQPLVNASDPSSAPEVEADVFEVRRSFHRSASSSLPKPRRR